MMVPSTYKVLVAQLRSAESAISELGRLACEAESQVALCEAKVAAASEDVEARAALVREIEALGREGRGRGLVGDGVFAWEHCLRESVSAREERRARRARATKRLAALRSIESDVGLVDREAWALSEREMAWARARKAAADLDAIIRCVLEGGVLRGDTTAAQTSALVLA